MTTASTALSLLVDGLYDILESMTSGRRLTAGELRKAVESLGHPLVQVPDWAWSQVRIERASMPHDVAYSMEVPLWTQDGLAHRAIELRLIETSYGIFDIEISGFTEVTATGLEQPTDCLKLEESEQEQTVALPTGRPVPERWRPVLGAIVHRLAIGDYVGLAREGLIAFAVDSSDARIGHWIDGYSARLVDLPPEAWAFSDYGETHGKPGYWWVIVDLWTAEEGRSDLSMEATVYDDGHEVRVEVNDVHMM